MLYLIIFYFLILITLKKTIKKEYKFKKIEVFNLKKSKWFYIFVIVILTAISFSLYSYFTADQKEFVINYNSMNDAYKKVLYSTGQNDLISVNQISDFKVKWNVFYALYRNDPIKPYTDDIMWQSDLDSINQIVISADGYIHQSNFSAAHLELEQVRQVWQKIFGRNNVSTLGFKLTEFHEIMEVAIEFVSDKKYDDAEVECKSMTQVWQEIIDLDTEFSANQNYISSINSEFETINLFCDSVTNGQLANLDDKASDVKKGFIPIYLKYG